MNEHAPGWYEHDGERRYWDGTRWTHSTSPAAPRPPVAPTPSTGVLAPYAPPPSGYAAPFPGGIMPARKEPGISLLLSFFIPGAGSMLNGDVGAGVGFLLLCAFGLVLFVCLGWILVGLIGAPIALLAWAGSMYHAYQGAVDHNRRCGYPG